MPIIAKLSKRFYERFGEDLANELVELLNQVDATSRADLRELNEANARHIDAVAQRLDGKIDAVGKRLDDKIDAVAKRLDAKIDAAVARLETKMDLFATKEAVAKLETAVTRTLLVQTRWMQVAWITILGAVLAQRFQR